MLSLTLFKQRGQPLADDFRGSVGYRGVALSEWEYLTLDKRLRDLGLHFLVREYTSPDTLPAPYSTTIKTPIHLTLSYDHDHQTSLSYPTISALDSTSIKTWLMLALKKLAPDRLSAADELIALTEASSVPSAVSAAPKKKSTPQPAREDLPPPLEDKSPDDEPVDDLSSTAASLFRLGFGIGGTLLVAALAITGVAVGSLAADNYNEGFDGDVADSHEGNDDEYPVYLESLLGGKLDFAKIWEERPPAKKKAPPVVVQNAPSSMETPLPATMKSNVNHHSDDPDDPTAGF
jgi:hypothetical protein